MQAAGDVVGGVMAARHLLRLAQDARARLHVVVVHLRRRRHRRIGEAQRRRVELVAGRHAQRVGLLVEVDGVLGAIGEAADDDARQPVLALEPDQVALEGDRLQDQAARLVRDHLAPVLALRVGQRRLADAEVLGAARVGGDDQACRRGAPPRTRGRARAARRSRGSLSGRSASIR